MKLLASHLPIIAGLTINLAATIYTIFYPLMSKELFTLYGISTGALYGYSQQLGDRDEL